MTRSIADVAGIGPFAAKILADHGIRSADDLAAATPEQLSKVPGFGALRAERCIAAARALVGADTAASGDRRPAGKMPRKVRVEERGQKEPRKKSKGKGNKKDKKRHKKKENKKDRKKRKDRKKGKPGGSGKKRNRKASGKKSRQGKHNKKKAEKKGKGGKK